MLPQHIQEEYNQLNDLQKQKFSEMVAWSNAGSPGNLLMADSAYESILRAVKQMGEEPVTPIEPDKTVNHDWDKLIKQNSNS